MRARLSIQTTGATFEFDQDIMTNSGGSVILDYKLPNGKIVLQNTYASNQSDQNNNITSIGFLYGTLLYPMTQIDSYTVKIYGLMHFN